jgi:hypothetical protein
MATETIAAGSNVLYHVLGGTSEFSSNPFLLTLLFTFAYDVIEVRVRLESFSPIWSLIFLTYTVCHMVLGAAAVYFVGGTIQTPWLNALAATVATEAIISNADIKVGQATLLPLADVFRHLRAKMTEEITSKEEAGLIALQERLSTKVRVDVLENAVRSQFIKKYGLEEATNRIAAIQTSAAGNNPTLRSAYAWELLLASPASRKFVRKQLRKWESETANDS